MYLFSFSFLDYKGDNLANYEDVIKCTDKLLELNPKNIFAYRKKGMNTFTLIANALFNLHRYEEANTYADRALILDQQNEDAMEIKGIDYS